MSPTQDQTSALACSGTFFNVAMFLELVACEAKFNPFSGLWSPPLSGATGKWGKSLPGQTGHLANTENLADN